MPDHETAPKITNPAVPLLGFGFYRRVIDQEWFHSSDYEAAIPEEPYKRLALRSRSSYTLLRGAYVELGFIETREGEHSPRGGNRQVMMRITDAVVEPLLENLTHRVRHTGLTVPDILYIPESVDAIFEHTDFSERLIAAVRGAAE